MALSLLFHMLNMKYRDCYSSHRNIFTVYKYIYIHLSMICLVLLSCINTDCTSSNLDELPLEKFS